MPDVSSTENQWFSDYFKEALAQSLCYVTIAAACFGAAASSFLAIPGLFALLSIEVPSLILNTIYAIAIINGVSYSISQFWDSLLENTRVNVFGLIPKEDSEAENLDSKIEQLKTDIINTVKNLIELDITVENNDLFKRHFTELKNYINFDQDILIALENENSEINKDPISDENSFYSFFINMFFYANKLLAYIVISAGIATSVILTILGTTNALNTLASMFFGPNIISSTAVGFMASTVACCTQYCKSSTFGKKQLNFLMLDGFHSSEETDSKDLSKKELCSKLESSLKDLCILSLKEENKKLRSGTRLSP